MEKIYMRYPEGRAKALTLSYDDGVEQDIYLIEIMMKNGLKGTFNISSGLYGEDNLVNSSKTKIHRMPRKQAIELYRNSGMEVAVHGFTHTHLDLLASNVCTYEILQDRINLEEDYNGIVRGMAYPLGSYNDAVVECVKQCGIVYARTIQSTETFAIPTDWLRLKATCHHNNIRLMELASRFIEENVQRESQLFYLWGHSYEFEIENNWEKIERFSEYVGNRQEIWYASNIDIYEYVNAYNQLVFSTNGKKVYNPTAKEVFFQYGEEVICMKPRQMIDLV